MWIVAVLLFISFVLLIFRSNAKTRIMRDILFCAAMAIGFVAVFLTPKTDDYDSAIMGFLCASIVISELIAIPVQRKRVIPPCVRVREAGQDRIIMIIGALLCIAFVVYLLVSSGRTLRYGIIPAYFIIIAVLRLFEKTEICSNGLWQYGQLQLWEGYDSFSWTRNRDDSVELALVSKSWIEFPLSWLTVAPEDREAVHQILEANLPDQSSGAEDRNT
jgi:hypothetical protein